LLIQENYSYVREQLAEVNGEWGSTPKTQTHPVRLTPGGLKANSIGRIVQERYKKQPFLSSGSAPADPIQKGPAFSMSNPTARSMPAAVSPSDSQISPFRITLDRAAKVAGEKGVPKNAFLFVYIALREGWTLDTLTLPQVQRVADCCRSTAQTIRSWIRQHNLIPDNDLDEGDKNLTHVMSSKLKNKAVSTDIHEPKNQPEFLTGDHTMELAVDQLFDLGFNQFTQDDGTAVPMKRRVERTVAWIQEHGAVNVLYQLHRLDCMGREGKFRPRIPGAFLRSEVQAGKTAPAGWVHPLLREQEKAPEEVAPPSILPDPETITPVPDVEMPAGWAAIHDCLEARMRPQIFNTWFKPTRFLPGEEDGQVEIWVTSDYALDWIQEEYRELLQEVLTSTELFDRVPEMEFRVVGLFGGKTPELSAALPKMLTEGGDR